MNRPRPALCLLAPLGAPGARRGDPRRGPLHLEERPDRGRRFRRWVRVSPDRQGRRLRPHRHRRRLPAKPADPEMGTDARLGALRRSESDGRREHRRRSLGSQPGLPGLRHLHRGRRSGRSHLALVGSGPHLGAHQRSHQVRRQRSRSRQRRTPGGRSQRRPRPLPRHPQERPVEERGRRGDLDQGRGLSQGRAAALRRGGQAAGLERRGPQQHRLHRLRSGQRHPGQRQPDAVRRRVGDGQARSLPQRRRGRLLEDRSRTAHQVSPQPRGPGLRRKPVRQLRHRSRSHADGGRRGLEAGHARRRLDRHHARQAGRAAQVRIRGGGRGCARPEGLDRELVLPPQGGRRLPQRGRRRHLETGVWRRRRLRLRAGSLRQGHGHPLALRRRARSVEPGSRDVHHRLRRLGDVRSDEPRQETPHPLGRS